MIKRSNAGILRAAGAICLTVLLIFSAVSFSPSGVAYADFPASYLDYIDSLPATSQKDWYLGEDYLNLDGIKSVLTSWKNDADFDWAALAADPVVIAVVDSGIGYAYETATGYSAEAPATAYLGVGLTYCISDLFDDVLLRDADGNPVYYSAVNDKVHYDLDGDGDADECVSYSYRPGGSTSAARKVYGAYSGDDMARILYDNTDDNHGTHVTATVALLIKALNLQAYVKIMPIKANTYVTESSTDHYTAGYELSDVTDALNFAEDHGADIVNLSLTAKSASYDFTSYSDSFVVVAAAGNYKTDSLIRTYYPAGASSTVGVMNYTYSEDGPVLSAMSNYGDAYDVAAPGTQIISLIDGDEKYGSLTGTSMASPITCVAAALAAVRYRGIELATGVEITPVLIAKMISLSSKSYTHDSYAQPVLNVVGIMTTEFLYDPEYADEIYVDTEGVEPFTLFSREHTLGELSPISMRARLVPTNSKTTDTVKWWYVYGGQSYELGTGETILFNLPDVVGTYAVYCKLVDPNTDTDTFVCTEPIVFTVNYAVFDPEDVEIVKPENVVLGRASVGDVLEFSVAELEYCSPSTAVIWYVNDVEVSREHVFSFLPPQGGDYTISVKVNGEEVSRIRVNVINDVAGSKLTAGEIAGISVGSVLFIALVTILAVYAAKKRKIKVATTSDNAADDEK